eukprot:TRINITY_DN1009_c3_g1_i1.p1 TRINITY_DN1009_c3_g1~~TRINITY_DN1009_c3_g1_i1.p1  ORF type:complete len:375 (+),score=25.86 TRINITY_DN1009_c3_g1_i1:103-1227(+)
MQTTVMLAVVTVSLSRPADKRLTVVNGCDTEPIWIANQGFAQNYVPPQMKKLDPGKKISYEIPNKGLESTRFWPLAGCNETSGQCAIGQSVGSTSNLPPCGVGGCAPAIDSKFEVTWGCTLSEKECGKNREGKSLFGPDYFDVSLVDGFSLPYKVNFGDCTPPRRSDGKKVHDFDATKLDYLRMCPFFNDTNIGEKTLDLRLHSPRGDGVVGCLSPCSRLTVPNWSSPALNYTTSSNQAKWYCCPAGSLGPGQQTPDKCESGPVNSTEYVANIHEFAPDVYAFAYDDGLGGYHCPANTSYTVTFHCPPVPAPGPPTPPPPTPAPTAPPTPTPTCQACTGPYCCDPTTSPPQKCLDGSYCCPCGAKSCECPSPSL